MAALGYLLAPLHVLMVTGRADPQYPALH